MAARLPAPGHLEVTISPMRRRHLRAVQRIEQQVYPRPWSMGLFMSELGLGQSRLYVVARVDGAVVGYGGLMLAAGDGHITTLAVDPAWHRHQVGTRLLLTLAGGAVQRGAEHLTLEVRASNQAAQELYRAFGFVPAGIRKGYYAETKEDAIVMWANDIAEAEFAARLDRLAQDLRGTTVHEELDR